MRKGEGLCPLLPVGRPLPLGPRASFPLRNRSPRWHLPRDVGRDTRLLPGPERARLRAAPLQLCLVPCFLLCKNLCVSSLFSHREPGKAAVVMHGRIRPWQEGRSGEAGVQLSAQTLLLTFNLH